jgi:hypothetical protein
MTLDEVDLATLEDDCWLNKSIFMAYLHRLNEGRPEWAVIDTLILAELESPGWERIA